MPGFSLSASRPLARALVVGNEQCRATAAEALARLGWQAAHAADPYSAFAEFCRRPLAYRSIILSLASLYREELSIVDVLRRRFPHVEIYLTQTDGRAAALAEANRMGATGLLSEEGLHPFADRTESARVPMAPAPMPAPAPEIVGTDPAPSPVEPLLTPDELRALLEG